MKRLQKVAAVVCLLGLSSLPSFAWTPFTGKTGYVISVIAVGLAHACDYKTTEQDITSGIGTEANPIVARVTNNRDHFIAFKIGAGAVPIAGELLHLRKHPEYLPVYTIANWGIAGSIGAVAWHNRQIYVQAGAPPPLLPPTARGGSLSLPPRLEDPR